MEIKARQAGRREHFNLSPSSSIRCGSHVTIFYLNWFSECASFYNECFNFELFELSIDNNNEIFLAYALHNNLFPHKFVDEDEIIKKMLN